jgi:hypothetical protein
MGKRREKEPSTPPTPVLEFHGMEQNGEINFVASGNSERAKYAIVIFFFSPAFDSANTFSHQDIT